MSRGDQRCSETTPNALGGSHYQWTRPEVSCVSVEGDGRAAHLRFIGAHTTVGTALRGWAPKPAEASCADVWTHTSRVGDRLQPRAFLRRELEHLRQRRDHLRALRTPVLIRHSAQGSGQNVPETGYREGVAPPDLPRGAWDGGRQSRPNRRRPDRRSPSNATVASKSTLHALSTVPPAPR